MTVLEKMALKFRSAIICIIIGNLCNHVVEAGSYCYKTVTYTFLLEYCDYGCCYEYSSSPCCTLNLGLIVGAVIGSLIGVAVLISGICLFIHCKKANTRQSPTVAPQICTTNTTYVQPMQPMGYQPFFQATVATHSAYPPPFAQPMPPPPYAPPAEPLPPPIYVEGTRPPADHQKS